ncbi:MAG: amidohydrolase [bacterium]|nr:amidohydrolase [bacterium]
MSFASLSRLRLLTYPSILLVALSIGCGTGNRITPADLVLTGGKVVTVDDQIPKAQAIAVSGYHIVAVGSDDEIANYVGDETKVVDLDGRLVIPGFIEGHGHFASLGQAKMRLDLTKATSWSDIVAQVAAATKEATPGEWITGRGWHQEKWTQIPTPNVDGAPLHHELSSVSPDNPVNLVHASGHASFANALALQLAGIGDDTADPPGGTIVRDGNGDPTGLLRETAQRIVGEAIAEAREDLSEADLAAEFDRIVELAGDEALSKGVTSFHDAGANFATIDKYRARAEAGDLPIRLYVMVRRETNEVMAERLADYRILPEGNAHLAVRSIKRQIDGALGAHGAWLLEEYEDHASTGLVLETVEDIEGTCRIAIEHGFQVNTHAIGDRANREVLDIYQQVLDAQPDKTSLRWRVEHAQHLHRDDLPRFAELGVIPAMQGIHCTSDGPWVLKRLGAERAESGAYLWRDLIDSGAVVTNGTDCPVEDIDPIASYHATVTRLMPNGEFFFPGQKMTRQEALCSYTLNNAYAAFEENIKGSLTPGKFADIVVLSRDILTIPDDQILNTKVDYTIVGGEIRFQR